MIYEPENQYYFNTEKDFPVRENPDYIDFVLDHAMYHRRKQFCFLEKAHQMVFWGLCRKNRGWRLGTSTGLSGNWINTGIRSWIASWFLNCDCL